MNAPRVVVFAVVALAGVLASAPAEADADVDSSAASAGADADVDSSAAPAEEEFESLANFPLVLFSERLTEGTEARPELVLQLPLPLLFSDSSSVVMFGGLYLDVRSFSRLGPANVYDLAIGRVYLGFLKLPHLFPDVSVVRASGITYDDLEGKTQESAREDWLLPGLSAAAPVGLGLRLHMRAELHEWSFDTYRIRAGVTRKGPAFLVLGIVGNYDAWDVDVEGSGERLRMAGDSVTVAARGILTIRERYNLAVDVGYEALDNAASPGLIADASVERDGFLVQAELSLGQVVW